MRSVMDGKQAEILFEILADKSPIGVYIVQKGKFCYTNPAFQSCTGYSENELVGRDSLELVFPEDRDMVRENAIRMLRGELASGYQFRVIHRMGSIRWVMESVSSIQLGGERATLGNYIDITERKETEESLRKSEERYRLLSENATDIIWTSDLKLKYTYVSPSVTRLLGYTPEEFVSLPVERILAPASLQVAMRVFREELKAERSGQKDVGRTRTIEAELTCKNGATVWVEVKMAFLRDQRENPTGVLGIARDITERRRTDQALKDSEERYRGLFENSIEAIFTSDLDHNITSANKALGELLDYGVEQLVGMNWKDVVHPESAESVLGEYNKLLRTGIPIRNMVYECIRKDGERRLTQSYVNLVKKGNRPVGFQGTVRDITEHKRENEQLMMADRLASIGELASGAAHELNNPLTSVIGFSQLLMDRDVPDDIREDLKLIHDEAQRATCVVKNLLTFARRHVPAKQLNQVNSIIEDVLRLRAYEQKVNNIEVRRKLALGLPKIMVDYFQMEQVFLNIILNAEYSMTEAQNGGTLTITTSRYNSTVVVSVTDNGLGIAQEHLGQLFNPFFTTKKAGKGTGLGLSICHGIVTEHGGKIYAKSQLGEGATFLVELPIDGA
ncbi:MAG: PAS domain S-box protein [Dehalococcoidia bacterium]